MMIALLVLAALQFHQVQASTESASENTNATTIPNTSSVSEVQPAAESTTVKPDTKMVSLGMVSDDLYNLTSHPEKVNDTSATEFLNDLNPNGKSGLRYTLHNPHRTAFTHWRLRDSPMPARVCHDVSLWVSENKTTWRKVDGFTHDWSDAPSRTYTRVLPAELRSPHIAWQCDDTRTEERFWGLEYVALLRTA